ncbi:hypothetical protein [Vibrio crassostreae]|uniref:hypothetical protein n=1 Tax=Vibrio crassostreae TaxID=246167 RepID=UPI001B3012A3|nr:hypothetical protein [Vibrio crassostreae]
MAKSKKYIIDLMTKKGFIVEDASEFYGEPSEGVWVKGATTEDAEINLSIELSYDHDSSPITDIALKGTGWRGEPYDAGTLMLFD